MPISDKTRKLLWGKAGNRCAFCKLELAVDKTSTDNESVIGDECHIISGKPGGPRYDSSFKSELLDEYSNLILLCKNHHKMVDDQWETFSVPVITKIKENHETWVTERLTESEKDKPVRVRRVKQNIPDHLVRFTSGKELLKIVVGSSALLTDHDEVRTREEADIVGGFFQYLQDCDELEPADQVHVSLEISEKIDELEKEGFWVFGGREVRLLEGGEKPPTSFPCAIIQIMRKDNSAIIKFKLDEETKNHSKSNVK